MKRIIISLILVAASLQAQTPFSSDSAAAYLKTLAVDIGGRPMGSPNEQRAFEFALHKFKEFGLDEAYLMPIRHALSQPFQTPIITNSGIAVGVLRGASDRIIVIGGHIDSSDPEVPGANDDGSGSATVLELARVFAQKRTQGTPNQSTIVFALFGGEERGLVGSEYFVEYFPQIDNVALMLQVDMTNGSEMLNMLIDGDTHSAPEWLVRAAYEEYSALGYTGLTYPTHFLTLNSALPGGGIGSDHQPFLDYGIPAIDFTSDMNDPIHTPQDTYENFVHSGLKRSGDLVYKLAERFDNGVPEETTGRYYLYDTGLVPLFIPTWMLSLFIVVSLAVSVFAWNTLRQRYAVTLGQSAGEYSPTEPKIPGVKLFSLMLIIQSCVWLSENIVGWIKGERFPWWSYLTGYFTLGFIAAVVGIWLALQILPRLNLSKNPSRYFLRAEIILAALIVLFALSSVKLAFYPASALLLLSLAALVRQKIFRLLLWFASAHLMYHLIFSEGFDLLAHSFGGTARPIFVSIVIHVLYIFLFALWSFPFLLGFATIRYDSGEDYFWLSRFKKRSGLILTGSTLAIWIGVLVYQPTFSELWKQKINVEQRIDLNTGTATLNIASNDYLSGTRVSFTLPDGAEADTVLSGWTSAAQLRKFSPTGAPWISAERTVEHSPATDTTTRVDISLTVHSRYRPYLLSVTYYSSTRELEKTSSPLVFASTEHTMTFRWSSFPDTVVTIPLSFTVSNNATVFETVEAVFVEPLVEMNVVKDLSNTRFRTTITQTTELKSP